MKTRVYANLTKNLWSIKNHESGSAGKGRLWDVCKYARFIKMVDVEFVVNQAGRKRVREEKKKYVHAYVQGITHRPWTDKETVSQMWLNPEHTFDHMKNFRAVTYNPYHEVPHFRLQGTDQEIHKSKEVYLVWPSKDVSPLVMARVAY